MFSYSCYSCRSARSDVAPELFSPARYLARAGAVAEHGGGGRVLYCGGRGPAEEEGQAHGDCLLYGAKTVGGAEWQWHSSLNS